MNKKVVIIVEDEPRQRTFLGLILDKRLNNLRQHSACIEDIQAEVLTNCWLRFTFEGSLNLRIFIDGIIAYLYDALEWLLKHQGKLSYSALLELLKSGYKIKALHKPLQVIPQSLRPTEFLAR